MAPGIFRGGLTLPTRGLKYGFQGTINAKNLPQNHFSPSDGGLPCSDGRDIAPLAPPLVLGWNKSRNSNEGDKEKHLRCKKVYNGSTEKIENKEQNCVNSSHSESK